MGGRGASSGLSDSGKKYGTEYTTLLQDGNVKFVRYNEGDAKTPQETMTKGRVYATVNSQDKVVAVTYYDRANKRVKQIDLTHPHEGKIPHTHHGYNHSENGTTRLTTEEKAMVERIKKLWLNRSIR